jgi:murein DD-endopeptidase MepM/ murein hydrolase activator NlpD
MTVRPRLKRYSIFGLCFWFAAGCSSVEKSPSASSTPQRQSASAQPSANASDLKAELSASEAVDGSIIIVTAKISPEALSLRSQAPAGIFEDIKIPFYAVPAKGSGVFEGVLGVPFSHKSGSFPVVVRYGELESQLPLQVRDGNYPSESLKVDPRKVNPKKKDMIRIKREQQEIRKVYDLLTEEKLWNGPFQLPIKSDITSIYGTKRVFNGEMKSFHAGLDLRAMVGTPIQAPTAGVVVLTGDLFFTGNTVILDHGYGIMTVYAHMSKIVVKKGQKLAPGDLLGLSGATGRVSGPHLHWMAIVHKTKVNPLELTKVMR